MTAAERRYDHDQLIKIIDPHFDRALEAGNAPGISYGVLVDGELVHARGLGSSVVDADRLPTKGTAYRIASMTKSFTAATLLSLRDEGLLTLDTPAVELVPEVGASGVRGAEITVRHLLTMGAGFLTDDPWGDRQQDLPIDAFRSLLRGGVPPVLAPGDRFEYSNLGFAVLGLVITAVSGVPYTEAVSSRVLEPLGMESSGFGVANLPTEDVATGYVKRSTGWVAEPIAASGAFSPMGGLISSVSDLTRWVHYLQSGGQTAEIMSAVSVREMQRTQRLVGGSVPSSGGEPATLTGYGFGLFEEHAPWGRTVFHSGGYPGFGSHMRWHPASGIGVIALANGTYAPMSVVSLAALADAVRELDAPQQLAPLDAPGLDHAIAVVMSWLAAVDPDGAEGSALQELLADNVEADLPWAERIKARQAISAEHGPLRPLSQPAKRLSAGAASWDLGASSASDAEPGRVRVTLMMAPHDPSLIQSLVVRTVAGGTAAAGPLQTEVS